MQKRPPKDQAFTTHSTPGRDAIQLMSDILQPLGASLPAGIAALAARAEAAMSLTEQVRNALPPEQGNHLLSASYRDDTLITTMDSAAWCPQVRYAAATILDRLKANGGPDFVKLKVKVGRVGVTP